MQKLQRKDNTMPENRATWLVNLWLSNDRDMCCYWSDRARELGNAQCLANEMNKVLDSHPLSNSASLYCDLLDDMLQQVDWLEVAKDFMEE
jgi:hypothetical protein